MFTPCLRSCHIFLDFFLNTVARTLLVLVVRFRPPAGVTLSEGDPPPPVSRVTPAGGKKKAKA